MKKYIFLISHIDMAERRHVVLCIHATWWRMCAYVRSYVRMRVISGLSIHYRFSLTHYTHVCYILVKSPKFMSCWTIYLCFYSHVTWHNLEQTIVRFNRDRRFSLTRGATWLYLIMR